MTIKSVDCFPSISKRLARTLAALMLAGLGGASFIIYCATAMRLHDAQLDTLADKSRLLSEFIAVASTKGETELLHKLTLFEPVRAGTRLTLLRGDGSGLFSDKMNAFRFSVGNDFTVDAPGVAGGKVHGRLEVDVTHDTHMLKGLAATLISATLLCALLTGMAIRWLMRRDLRPLQQLAAQTRAISPQRLDQRLYLERPAEELQPMIDQFNALMERLERAYAQLEGFNADVAHELRTPLSGLRTTLEVMLSKPREARQYHDALAECLDIANRLKVKTILATDPKQEPASR